MPSTKHTHTHTRTHARYIYLYIAHIVYGSGTLASCSDAAQSLQLVKVFEPQLKSQLTATSTLAPNLWQLQSTEIRYAKKRLPRAKPRYASQGSAGGQVLCQLGLHTPQHFIFL